MKIFYYWAYAVVLSLLFYFVSTCLFITIPTIILLVVRLVMDLVKIANDSDHPNDPVKYEYSYKIFKGMKGFIFVIAFFLLGIGGIGKQVFQFYNQTVEMKANYVQKSQEKEGFYDKLYKSYVQKFDIASVNKDVFIEVSKIIMENRRDGGQLAWKWVRETQQVPYEVFTSFYKDLSSYIETQRDEYFKIEKECQVLAKNFNVNITKVPNVFYAKLLGVEKIEFQYGFLSDHTNTVFKSKIENVE